MIKKEYLILSASTLLLGTFVGLTAYLTDQDGPLKQPLKAQYGTDFDITIYNEPDEDNPVYDLEEQIITPDAPVTLTPVIRNDGDYKIYVFMELNTTDDNMLSIETGEKSLSSNDSITEEDEELVSSDWCKVNVAGREIYAYGDENQLKALNPGDDITSHLYTTIKVKPNIEITDENEYSSVEAVGYAIQTDGIESTDPDEVWELIESSTPVSDD